MFDHVGDSSSRGPDANGFRGTTTKGRSVPSEKMKRMSCHMRRRGLMSYGIEIQGLPPKGTFAFQFPVPVLLILTPFIVALSFAR